MYIQFVCHHRKSVGAGMGEVTDVRNAVCFGWCFIRRSPLYCDDVRKKVSGVLD